MATTNDDIKKLKDNLVLDFSLGPSQTKHKKIKGLLETPDLDKIGWSTPELDLVAMNCKLQTPGVLPTFIRNEDSDEDKLNKSTHELWSNQLKLNSNNNDNSNQSSNSHINNKQQSKKSKKENTSHQNRPRLDSLDSKSDSSLTNMDQKLGPINMEDQERIKLERKRYRNRIAASKCRQRKLERISKLEKQVNLLKSKNVDLQRWVHTLKEVNEKLHVHAMKHQNSGCEITIEY